MWTPSKYRFMGIGILMVGIVLSISGIDRYAKSTQPWLGAFVVAEAEGGDGVNPVLVGKVAVFQSTRMGEPEAGGETGATDTPFTIRFEDVKSETSEETIDVLEVDVFGDTTQYNLNTTKEIAVAGQRFTVSEIRRWSGLLREAQGEPMLALSLKIGGEVITGVILRDGESDRLALTPTLTFAWYATEEEARQSATANESPTQFSRWGVDDRGIVHWFTSFLPGTGAELSDGSIVTLMHFDAGLEGSSPRLIVDHKHGDDTRRYELDSPASQPPIHFEHPLAFEGLLGVYAWSEREAIVVYRQAGESVVQGIQDTGAWISLRDDMAIRVEQMLPTAFYIPEESSPLFEVVLERESDVVRVRQGEAIRIGDALLRYSRAPKPGPSRFYMAYENASGTETAFNLGPEESYTLETPSGAFLLRYEDIRADTGVLLRPLDMRLPARLYFGIALVILGRIAGRIRIRPAN